jgi:hypothetical protein
VYVTEQVPLLSRQAVAENAPPPPPLLQVTIPLAVVAGAVVSATVAVQVVVLPGATGFGTQATVVVVASPPLRIAAVPVAVSSARKPLHVDPLPGTQSLMLELVEALACVVAWTATIWPGPLALAPKALSGKLASTKTAWPLLHAAKSQLCFAAPVVVIVPRGRSTCTDAPPRESKSTQPMAFTVDPPVVSTRIEKPSLVIELLLLVSVSSQRT